MDLEQIESRLVSYYVSSSRKDGPALHVQSAPGIGKTSTLALVADKLTKAFPGKRWGVVVINGATVTLTTATGYLMPTTIDGHQYSNFTRPAWWTMTPEGEPLENYDGGVIIIDEIDKMGSDEKKIMGEAALSKVLGTHRLPPGWVVWFAGNRPKDRSGSSKDFDHLINRRITIEVTPSIKALLRWMERNNCLAETRVFAEENTQLVFTDAPDQQGPWCTPRSLAQADGHLQALMETMGHDQIPLDPTTQEELAGGIGPAAAAQYVATVKLGQELPPYEKIIADPTKVTVPSKPDGKRLAVYKLASQVSNKDMEAVLTYVKRFQPEFQIMFGKCAVTRDQRLVANKHFYAWCQLHSSLIELMTKLK